MKQLDNHYAIIIGVGYLEKDLYMRDDAEAIYDVLVDKDIAGYKRENVKLLTGENASKENIEAALLDLAHRTNKDSKVMLYYSGHGNWFFNKEKKKNEYFLELYGYYFNNANDKNTKPHLMGKSLRQYLNKINADRLIFFFDCCHAQGLTNTQGITEGDELKTTAEKLVEVHGGKNEERDKVEGLVHQVDDEEGFAIISSCKDHQKSLRHNDHPNSLFTTCLIEALKGDNIINPKDPFVRLTDVVNFLSEEVPKRASEWNKKQDPFFNLSFDDNFELCRVPKNKITARLLKEFEGMDLAPPAERIRKPIKKYFRKGKGANNVLVFAHGFTGKGHETFGKIPYFLMGNEKMNGWDVFPFGINQNITPSMGKGIWASIENINRYAENLRSRIVNEFSYYDRIAIVAYSLGGLAVQRAIIELDPTYRDRISHLILVATPSNGITNNALKKHLKQQLNELIEGAPFIRKLRSDWSDTFKDEYPFSFKTVAATRDEFVSKESCLDPFDKKYWEVVSGDHYSVVEQETNENDTYQLILGTLTNSDFFKQYTDPDEVNLLLGKYDRIIDNLKPNLDKLDEQGLEKLVHALEGSGNRQEAIEILKNHKLAQEDSDMLRVLGDLYKNRYLNDSRIEDGEHAMECYTKAFKIAKMEKDKEDVYLSAIDLAFLNLIMEGDKKDMIKYAEQALKLAMNSLDSLNRSKTMAEANIYLSNIEDAKAHYIKASEKAGVKEKISIYTDAITAYSALRETDDPSDEFVLFMKKKFLS